ncbi:MAG: 30S ribosomal protein S14 [Candidatus Diapherotrites archaeon]
MKAQQKKRPKTGRNAYCLNCHNNKGMVHKYGINLCRRCFKEFAPMMGFKKYS